MAVTNYNGRLNPNEIFASIYNMIINLEVYGKNIGNNITSIADMCRVDGGQYGDTILKYSTDVLQSYPWLNDAESANLLKLYRPKDPACQAITIDVFRQIPLTVDNYLTKRAWMEDNAFSTFTSIMLGWMRDTKKVYDAGTVQTFIGTNETTIGLQDQTITFQNAGDAESTNRLEAQSIAEKIANIIAGLRDFTRNYNDYGYLRSTDISDLVIIWNTDFRNKILKIDLPTIFHNQLFENEMTQMEMTPRFFGKVNATGGTVAAKNATICSLIETDYTVSDKVYHVFPGDLLPDGAKYEANTTYTIDNTIICKIMHKKSVPYMSSFQVGTSFFNPKSLTENHYTTFSHNTLTHLYNYPFITLRGVDAQ